MCKGGSLGIMTGFNRIGCRYVATHTDLITDVLKGEWAFQGHVTTDAGFEEGAASFSFQIGEHQFFHTTANLAEAPAEGSLYTYSLATGDPNAPFECDMFLQIREDGTAEVTTTAAGPINASHIYGAWTLADGMICVEW